MPGSAGRDHQGWHGDPEVIAAVKRADAERDAEPVPLLLKTMIGPT
jgi:hypothetical protein